MGGMRRSIRESIVLFALIAIPLAALAVAGGAAALRQIARDRDMAVDQSVAVLGALVADVLGAVRREAIALARDPALVESAARGDWAMLARSGAPRLVALTRGGGADLVSIRDASGAPLAQVPTLPRSALAGLEPGPGAPAVALRIVDGRAYFLAVAAIANPWVPDSSTGKSLGTVVVGRSLDAVDKVLGAVPSGPGLVMLDTDRAVAGARYGEPAGGWRAAAAAGRAAIGSESLAMRPLAPAGAPAPGGALWGIVPETGFRMAERRLRSWLLALVGAGVAVLALGVAVIVRRGRPSRRAPAAPVAE
jgi:hypothetical protein